MTDQPNWSDLSPEAKGDLIRPLIVDDQLTYAQIAARFGISRNAIAGVARKRGIKSPLTKGLDHLPGAVRGGIAMAIRANQARAAEAKRKRQIRMDQRREAKADKPKHPHPFVAQHIPEDAIDRRPPKADAWLPLGPPEKSIPLDQLTEHTCKWPVTPDLPFLFCGQHTAPNKPYCPTHTAAAYRPAPEIRLKRKKGTTNA